MKKSVFSQGSKLRPAGFLSGLGRRLLSAVLILLAACPFAPSFAQTLPENSRRSPVRRIPQRTEQQPTDFRLTARPDSITLCPGKPSQVQLFLTGPEVRSLEYLWEATGGRLKGSGRAAVWDLSGVKPGTYTTTVAIRFRGSVIVASPTTQVAVSACREEPPPACPGIRVVCPRSVVEGEPGVFTASIKGGGQPRGRVTYEWTVTAGAAVGRDRRSIKVDTSGLGGQSIEGKFEVGGYGLECSATCRTFVTPRPTPPPEPPPSPEQNRPPAPPPTPFLVATPSPSPEPPVVNLSPTTTPTPTPTPTPSPSASPTPPASPSTTPDAIAAASPAASLSPESDSSGTFDATRKWRLWLWLLPLLLLAVLAAVGALIRAKVMMPAPPLAGAEDQESEGGMIAGGQKKVSDEVRCTVFAPEQAAPGDPFAVQVFAHLAEEAEKLAALAARADQAARDRGSTTLHQRVERGREITFTLSMPGLKVRGRKKSLVWRGVADSVQFAVDVPVDFLGPEDGESKPIRGWVKIYYEGHAPVGEIMFMFRVVRAGAPASAAASPPGKPPQEERRFTHAFVSYSSADRARVLVGLQGLKRGWELAGITHFIDLQGIKAGRPWRKEIQKHLDRCDLFVLFWSSAAKRSEEIRKEISYALDRKGGSDENPPAFDPFTIEVPVPMPLPEGLETLHFGDELLYIIKAEEALTAERVAGRARPGTGTVQT